ncbi:short-chain dehydrogenase [Microbacterium sp. CH12i]|uniref:SDR family NAD(P)-dependent oxidoreductase n=1 Tax=Microbacterium sp. CH12i TaxID=1479651 RepID=UPI000460DDDE|nr:glucose 1-dehydrogenase [Microbacterium sp. CH12i]KDA06531.1 short-chain dehydrogenase [Microbacterium sp. CH12i]
MIKFDFSGKTVVITGGATGIGRATARAYAEADANVVIGDVSSAATETVELINAEHAGRAVFVKTDVTEEDDVKNLIKTAVETFGSLDVAFNNAGVLPPVAPLVEQTVETFRKVIAVDLVGVFIPLKYEIAYMKEHGGGAIVNTASVAGLIADPDMAPYVAAKHGVAGLTKAAAIDHGKDGIRVNAIAPGLVDTAMTQVWKEDPAKWAEVTGANALGRAASPEEIASTVLYLTSPEAGFISGGVYPIDAGTTAH